MRRIDSEWLGGELESEILLSVVITNYNYAQFLPRAVTSVVSQLPAGAELVVMDDGSHDSSVDVLAALRVPAAVRAAFTVQENAGPAAARNAALRFCSGTWVLFLDADDELLKGGLAGVVGYLQDDPAADLLLCGMHVKHEDGKEVIRSPSILSEDIRTRLRCYLIHKKVHISHGASIFRRDCVLRRPYPERLRQGEDIAVFAYMLAQPNCRRLDIPLARIYKHRDSLRHDADLVLKNNELIASEVFSSLPAYMAEYFGAYQAKRALSAFRSCCRAGRKSDAQRYFRSAVSHDMRQSLTPKYIFKYLRLLFSR